MPAPLIPAVALIGGAVDPFLGHLGSQGQLVEATYVGTALIASRKRYSGGILNPLLSVVFISRKCSNFRTDRRDHFPFVDNTGSRHFDLSHSV
jgi:hypothetical protein